MIGGSTNSVRLALEPQEEALRYDIGAMAHHRAHPAQVALLKEGVAKWNEWRLSFFDESGLSASGWLTPPVYHPDLTRADLSEENLGGADLTRADLRRADLRRADLTRADLSGADLTSANLSGAELREANLSGANLTSANLSGADLRGANLNFAILGDTNLSGVHLATSLGNVDLRRVKGLESVEHEGPSHISIATVYRSAGEIPEVFLRGTGVPEPFIVQMKALVGAMQPIQFYSCFISYASEDQVFAERLYADLRAKNVRCWFAPHNISAGKKIHEQIDEAIQVYDRLCSFSLPIVWTAIG
jgi:uncharacterized protein YjbI with pentapeptide repeats